MKNSLKNRFTLIYIDANHLSIRLSSSQIIIKWTTNLLFGEKFYGKVQIR